jgi:large subunit ribosomal protein L5
MKRPRLQERYLEKVKPALKDKFGYDNPMIIPSLQKIVINMGVAEAVKDKNILQDHINELKLISGQKPVLTKSKKSISNFKLREGYPIGIMVTLRKKRMYDFLDRFIKDLHQNVMEGVIILSEFKISKFLLS